MLLIDFNGVVVGTILQMKDPNEDLVRHTILNILRSYSHKYKKEYGRVVIACDSKSWRKDFYPQYKYKRKVTKDDNKEQYDNMYEIMGNVLKEIEENLPYQVVKVFKAEADDIIATIIKQTQEFGQYEKVMLISSDKDFIQLHRYDNVKQYSPKTKKFVTEKNIDKYIFEHILKGDGTDGIPNVLSGDNVFVDEIRQSPMTQKKMDSFWDNKDKLKDVMTEEQYRNYVRNKTLVSLDEIPENIVNSILDEYKRTAEVPKPNKMKLMNYLMSKKCKLLLECIDEF